MYNQSKMIYPQEVKDIVDAAIKKAAAAPAKKADIIAAAAAEVDTLTAIYKKRIAAKYTPQGARLTADANLLELFAALDPIELERLFDIYDGNDTMRRYVVAYAAAHNITLDRTFYTAQQRADAAAAFAETAKKALQEGKSMGETYPPELADAV